MKLAKKKFPSLWIASFFMMASCLSKEPSSLDQASWLIGTWTSGQSFETWTSVNSQKFIGKSYSIKNGDTTIQETLELIAEGDLLFYIPTVVNQNDGQSVRFASTSLTDTELIFENKQHDFPQEIKYKLIKIDSIVAEISGVYKDGKQHAILFPMKRIK